MQQLRALLESGALLHPVSDAISIVDFANALHSVMGVPDVPAPLGEHAAQVKGLIGEPEHLVMALADGFGMNFVEALDYGSFVRQRIAAEMRTVFPSTTPIVLTTLATGQWPATHSVIGWFQRLRETDAVSTIITYQRTADKKALSELGVSAETAYPVPSRMGKTDRDALHIMPEHIVATAYSNYWTGYIRQHGYDADHPQQAIEMAIQAVRKSRRRHAFTSICHRLTAPRTNTALGTQPRCRWRAPLTVCWQRWRTRCQQTRVWSLPQTTDIWTRRPNERMSSRSQTSC